MLAAFSLTSVLPEASYHKTVRLILSRRYYENITGGGSYTLRSYKVSGMSIHKHNEE